MHYSKTCSVVVCLALSGCAMEVGDAESETEAAELELNAETEGSETINDSVTKAVDEPSSVKESEGCEVPQSVDRAWQEVGKPEPLPWKPAWSTPRSE